MMQGPKKKNPTPYDPIIQNDQWWDRRRIVSPDPMAGFYLLLPEDRDILTRALPLEQLLQAMAADDPRPAAITEESEVARIQAERDEAQRSAAALRAVCATVLGHLDGSTGEVDAVAILQAALADGTLVD